VIYLTTIKQRIKIAKAAVKTVREQLGYGFSVLSPPIIVTMPEEWAFGINGILDFIVTGNPNKILIIEIRTEVEKALAKA